MTKVNSPFNLVKAAFLLLLLLVYGPVVLASSSVNEQIIEHVKAQRFEQAYQLALAHKAEWEGDPAFDTAYGLAAKGKGYLQEALFAFERVLETNPTSVNVRFYVAVCYFESGNSAAALSELNLLKSLTLPEGLAEQVAQYLSLITRQQKYAEPHWQNWLQVAVGHDDNPNNGIEEDEIFIPGLGDINVFEQNQEVSSAFSLHIRTARIYTSGKSKRSCVYLGICITQ